MSASHDLYQGIYRVAKVLEVPVVVLALLSLAVVIVELGRFGVEIVTRRRRPRDTVQNAGLTEAALAARRDLATGAEGRAGALRALQPVAWSAAMSATYTALVAHAGEPGETNRVAKDLADFDFGRVRRLERTRLLVRVGPALGLMGTLIPLTPALDGLAKGNVAALAENLRVAFSVTVLGLLVGAIAFGISLARDRMYGQDYSDLEYVASVLTDPAYQDAP